ncbi:MAG TPA: phasin family protein [Thermoanaerobaculia bacterium]|nr:phasin family protein [Thermoanaerobaculia bacterium]
MTAKKKQSTRKTTSRQQGSERRSPKQVQEELRASAHKIWLAGLGAMASAEEEGSRFFKKLVERGERFESRGKEAFDEAKERAEQRFERVTEKVGSSFEEQMSRTLERLGVPSRHEVESLGKKIDALNRKIDRLTKAE